MARDDNIWNINGFTRWRHASSAVGGDYLILDGGELTNKQNDLQTHFLASTLAIDLRHSWTNATVKPQVFDKPPRFPFARRPLLWYNPLHKTIQSTGGTSYTSKETDGWNVSTSIERNRPVIPAAVSLWDFALPVTSSQADVKHPWSVDNTDFSSTGSSQVSGLAQASGAATSTAFYALGGVDDHANVAANLLEYDFESEARTYMTSDGFGPAGYGADNQVVFSPLFGQKGVLIYIGGYAPGDGKVYSDSSYGLQDMMAIQIYDIAQQTFSNQTATLNADSRKPSKRWGFCTVPASEANSSTLDIFVHGGLFGSETDTKFNPTYANVYVLSLPSFVWTEIPRSQASQRALHTCQLIGNRQMAVLGGDDTQSKTAGETADPWTNGIGIFDVSAWRWSNKYDASAKPYKRAQPLVDMSAQQFTASSWNSDAVKQLFNIKAPPAHSSSSNGGSGSGGDAPRDAFVTSGAKTGPIAGGVVGAIALLALITVAIMFLRNRRKTAAQREKDQEATSHLTDAPSADATISSAHPTASSEPSSAYPTDIAGPSGIRREMAELESPATVTELEGPPAAAELYGPIKTLGGADVHPATQLEGVYRPADVQAPERVHEIGTSDIARP